MIFLERLLSLIEQKGISKNKMLTDLKINKNAFLDWSKKNQTPNGETLVKISQYFNVSIDFLLGLDESTVATPQGDVINTTENKESERMSDNDFVTKSDLERILKANNAEIIEALSELLRGRKIEPEASQDSYFEASGGN